MTTTRATFGPTEIVSRHGTLHQVVYVFVDWSPDRKFGAVRPVPWCGTRRLGGVSTDLRRATRYCGSCVNNMAAVQRRAAS